MKLLKMEKSNDITRQKNLLNSHAGPVHPAAHLQVPFLGSQVPLCMQRQ